MECDVFFDFYFEFRANLLVPTTGDQGSFEVLAFEAVFHWGSDRVVVTPNRSTKNSRSFGYLIETLEKPSSAQPFAATVDRVTAGGLNVEYDSMICLRAQLHYS